MAKAIMGYSRDGDQLCSNFAIAFAFCALIMGIVPQSTCSFVSVNPSNLTVADQPQAPARALQGVIEELDLPTRNISVSNYTVNIGFWKAGSAEIDGQCYNIDDLESISLEDASFVAGRAMGIVASISGFVALVAACFGCHRDDDVRRKWNVGISALYFLAGLASWLTMLIFNSDVCQGETKTWNTGYDQSITLQYDQCYCRAGCFLSIVAALCYMISAVTVLIKTG